MGSMIRGPAQVRHHVRVVLGGRDHLALVGVADVHQREGRREASGEPAHVPTFRRTWCRSIESVPTWRPVCTFTARPWSAAIPSPASRIVSSIDRARSAATGSRRSQARKASGRSGERAGRVPIGRAYAMASLTAAA